MKVLIACEFSGVVREAFRKHGYEAYSCDVIPSLDNSPYHIQDDVLLHINDGWDLMIAHPPCTRLCNSGVTWLYDDNGNQDVAMWNMMNEAAMFFCDIAEANVKYVCIENPIMHGYAKELIFPVFDKQWTIQKVQPWQYGHNETKSTLLHNKMLPNLNPTCIVYDRQPSCYYESPGIVNGLTRAQRRSITKVGIANAMAEQWVKYVASQLESTENATDEYGV